MAGIKITNVDAIQILDSRGNPTIETEITGTKKGKKVKGTGMAPSGASRGIYEAWELRDNGKEYNGKSVHKAVANAMRAGKIIKGKEYSQATFDAKIIEMAGENKRKLGGNTTTALSFAFLNMEAQAHGKQPYEHLGGRTMPVPFMNIINGGKHAGNGLAVQEFMIAPTGAKTFEQAVRMGSEIYHALGTKLAAKYGKTAINVGDEGGFAPPVTKTQDALDNICTAIEEAGYAKKVFLAMDAAASEFYNDKQGYSIDNRLLAEDKLAEYYEHLCKTYPIISIEDPFSQEDYDSFAMLTRMLKKVQVVGDDLTVTNSARVHRAIEQKAITTLLMKVNQIGTFTEARQAFECCKKNGINTMVSHRSGETEDTIIADIAVGLETGQIKTGAPCRGERTAKYNRMIRIEKMLGKRAKYANISVD